MPLKFNGRWRFEPPANTEYFAHTEIPDDAISEFIDMINKVATQADRWEVLEHFKRHFCRASGTTHMRSSNVGWAETDLWRDAEAAAKNAPMFIEAFFDACRSFTASGDDRYAPDEARINDVLARHRIGYEIRDGRLLLRGEEPPLVPVATPPPTLAEQSVEVIQTSLRRAEELLQEGKGREAVQESLWLLETVSTAFRGIDTESGTVGGKYFNRIVKELRAVGKGGTLDRVLEWASAVHGYLSSPTGGGVRHGLDLHEGVPIDINAARLFCNLIRSYVSYLLLEHERMSKKP
jgi:hypothetical protein